MLKACQVPQPCLAEQHPLRPFSLQHEPYRAVSAVAIEGAAPSLSMCQEKMPFSVSICVHVALGVVDNETQLFTNEEQWTRNDGFECYHLSMLPCRDPGPIPDERIPSPCAILFNSFATLHHLTNRNSTLVHPEPTAIPRKPRHLLFRSSDLSQDSGATLLLRQLCCCLGRSMAREPGEIPTPFDRMAAGLYLRDKHMTGRTNQVSSW